MTRKNSTCSTGLYKGRDEALGEFRAICKTNTAASMQPVQLAGVAITHGMLKGGLPVWHVPGAITTPHAPKATWR